MTLIYGQNGSGKSTASGYFYDRQADKYRHCVFESPNISLFQVFNQEYIDSKFARWDYQPGIFTLSETNQESQDKITNNYKERARLSVRIDKLNAEIAEKEGMKDTITGRCAQDILNRTVITPINTLNLFLFILLLLQLSPGLMLRRILRLAENTNDRNH